MFFIYFDYRHEVKQDMQCTYDLTMDAHSCKHCCSGKAICITYCECVFVALGICHAMRVRHIIIIWRAPLLQYFPAIINGKIFFFWGGGNLLNTKCVF